MATGEPRNPCSLDRALRPCLGFTTTSGVGRKAKWVDDHTTFRLATVRAFDRAEDPSRRFLSRSMPCELEEPGKRKPRRAGDCMCFYPPWDGDYDT